MLNDLEARASAFATRAHEGQVRKYTGAPYITHPEAVAALVHSVPHTEYMLAAAWLHDTVEDCGVPLDEVTRLFGPAVGAMVEMLTDVSKPGDGNRRTRKEIDRDHSAKASPIAKTVKLADLIDNSRSIVALDPAFAVTYLEEKRLLLPFLREGDATLWAMANEIVERGVR